MSTISETIAKICQLSDDDLKRLADEVCNERHNRRVRKSLDAKNKFRVGHRVQFRHNNKNNVGTVTKICVKNLQVRLDDGKKFTVDPMLCTFYHDPQTADDPQSNGQVDDPYESNRAKAWQNWHLRRVSHDSLAKVIKECFDDDGMRKGREYEKARELLRLLSDDTCTDVKKMCEYAETLVDWLSGDVDEATRIKSVDDEMQQKWDKEDALVDEFCACFETFVNSLATSK